MEDPLERTSVLNLPALYHAERPRLVRIAAGMELPPTDAQDAVQEGYLGLLLRKERFRTDQDARHWLLRVVVDRCMLPYREAARAKALEGSAPAQDSVGAAGRDKAEAVQSAMNGLCAEHRVMIVLRYFCDLDEVEIGKLFDIPAPTVRSRIYRARLTMAAVLTSDVARDSDGEECPNLQELLVDFSDGELGATTTTHARMARHLGSCGDCRQLALSLKKSISLARAEWGSREKAILRQPVRKRALRFAVGVPAIGAAAAVLLIAFNHSGTAESRASGPTSATESGTRSELAAFSETGLAESSATLGSAAGADAAEQAVWEARIGAEMVGVARMLDQTGARGQAVTRLKYVVDAFPETQAARDAAARLEKPKR